MNPDPNRDKSLLRGQRYLAWLMKHRRIINSAALVITLVALALASKLYLKPSFSALLPQELPSVKQLNAVMEEVGGTGLLLIGIESPSFRANREFADKLGSELEKLPNTKIRDFEFHFKDARDYFEKFGLYYLSTEDLTKLRDRLETEVKVKAEEKKNEAFASFLGLDDDPKSETNASDPKEPRVDAESTLTESLDPRIKNVLEYPKDYLASEDGKLVVIGIRTAASSLSVGDAKKLTDEIRTIINQLEPQTFNSEMQVNFAGNVQRAIDEVETVKKDIVDTALLLIALILLCLYLFFQSWPLVTLLVVNLGTALVWTLGLAQITVGYLNTLTAFMSSLVVGTGINYSCILISRYLEERRGGSRGQAAVAQSLVSTALPTLAGSSTTAASFTALFFANNKGFSEFAIIGGSGILICWLLTYVLFPIWLLQIESRVELHKSSRRNAERLGSFFSWFGVHTLRRPKSVSFFLLSLTLASLCSIYLFVQHPFEYDFRKLGNKVSANKTGASGLHKRIQDEVYRSSLTPAAVLIENEAMGKALCPTVRDFVAALPESERNFQSCLSLYDLLPKPAALEDETPYKDKLRSEVRELMGNKWLKRSDAKIAEIMLNIHQKTVGRAPTVEDLPEQMKRRFRTLDGRDGRVAFIYSDNAKPLEDGRNLIHYTNAFGKITLPNDLGTVGAAGENFVLADLLRSIKIDGPNVSLISFAAVIALAFFLTGGFLSGLVMSICLISATVWLMGIQGFFDVKFNFLNFIALPLTFGIGVDYPINIYCRFKEQGLKNFSGAMKTTGAAVFLCSMTTIIGYLTLFEASNQALISFARLALIGEFTCLIAAFLGLPLIFSLLKRRRGKSSEGDQATNN